MSLLHVRQIESHLRTSYSSDYWRDGLEDRNNLSRLLSRWALDLALGERAGEGTALVEVTDAGGDRGIDGVAVDPVTPQVVLVQSKWRDDGSGSVDLASVLKFIDGVRALLDIESEGPSGCSMETRETVRQVMQTPGARLLLVIATTAADDLSPEVRRPLDDLLSILNDVSEENPIADLRVLTQSGLYEALSRPAARQVDLDVPLLDWGKTTEPVSAYYGRVNALQVAEWFETYGSDLFAENIRVVLPRSEINDGILRTLRNEPELFWYFNNGITILATQIERSLTGAASRDAGFFKAIGASVVNGAQTASTLGRALREKDGRALLEKAYVAVRCIEVVNGDNDLSRKITRYANTQNVVSTEDFVWLDENQHRLVRELRLQGFEYILRSGEVPVSKDPNKIVNVRQAATSLACATGVLDDAVLAKREVSRLFEGATYKKLFNPTVNALTVVRAVQMSRAVETALARVGRNAEGLRAGVAVHGTRVITHLVLDGVNLSRLGEPSLEFDPLLVVAPQRAIDWLDRLEKSFPSNAYPGNVFKNAPRCRELIRRASEN
jgi:hypothetical protein